MAITPPPILSVQQGYLKEVACDLFETKVEIVKSVASNSTYKWWCHDDLGAQVSSPDSKFAAQVVDQNLMPKHLPKACALQIIRL